MQSALERTDLDEEDRLHFEFALGKALEDEGSYESSFAHYAARQRAAPAPSSLQRGREPAAS